jgi:hypothetical protein
MWHPVVGHSGHMKNLLWSPQVSNSRPMVRACLGKGMDTIAPALVASYTIGEQCIYVYNHVYYGRGRAGV